MKKAFLNLATVAVIVVTSFVACNETKSTDAAPVDAAPTTEVAPVDAAPTTEVTPVEAAPTTEVAPTDVAPAADATKEAPAAVKEQK